MASGIPNGSAAAPIEVTSSQPTVVGINFGNAYASIAVLNKVRTSVDLAIFTSDLVYRRDRPSALPMRMVSAKSLAQCLSTGRRW